MVPVPVLTGIIEQVEDLEDSARLAKGFGSSGPQPNFELKSNGGVTFQGFGGSVSWNPGQCSWSFICPSDRNLKENIIPVDPETVLQNIVKMPISAWSYKGDPQRHIGPMAQDFYNAFGTGQDDKHISPLDEQGVALAAIKALNQKLEEKDAEIQYLKQRVAGLEKQIDVRLTALERAVGNPEANAAPHSIKAAYHTAASSSEDE